MSCIIRKNYLEEELKQISSLSFISNVRFVNDLITLHLSFKTKDANKLTYLELIMTKHVVGTKPFEYSITKNELARKIDIEKILDKFLNSFYWEEGCVLLKDFFKM